MAKKSISGAGKQEGDGKKEEEVEKNVDEVYNDPKAGVTLVSSDNVIFRVHRYYLEAVSPVFRDMIEACEGLPTPIVLTDESIEHSMILGLLLDLAYNKPFVDFDKTLAANIVKLARLAEKYDCIGPLSTNLWNRFVIACTLDMPEAAHRLMPQAAKYTWSSGEGAKTVSVHDNIYGGKVLDLTTMCSANIDRLPRPYFLCLLRASRLRMSQPPGTWQEVADDFLAQLLLIKPKPSSTPVDPVKTT